MKAEFYATLDVDDCLICIHELEKIVGPVSAQRISDRYSSHPSVPDNWDHVFFRVSYIIDIIWDMYMNNE